MRHVKKDYEVCATHYQSTMAKLGQAAATTTTTSTTFHSVGPTMATHPAAALRSSQYNAGHDVSQQRHHHHHQHDHAGHIGHPNSTKSVEDAEEERLKTVCCAFQKYMQCSEFTVRHACGDETALFTRKFLDKMSNTLMRFSFTTGCYAFRSLHQGWMVHAVVEMGGGHDLCGPRFLVTM
ncbi:hypothetical protein ZHAS_00005043 [Anopheles sinensis]|uniref:Uncharacterized protein n=1 Tax=Anopheles sinensis TaxID=74873 RepID=A0A084VID7_ANOSI|nr:hypothetical protein ZHAS_00005043 [Anopheles sinensis]